MFRNAFPKPVRKANASGPLPVASPSYRWLRVLTWGLSTVAAAGCASGGGGAGNGDMGGTRMATTTLAGAGGTGATSINTVRVTDVNSTIIMASPDKVFQALSAAYATLKIPVNDLDQAKRTLGNSAFRVRRKIGDVQTVKALDCGGDSGMPNAETYQLVLSIYSRVIPNDAGGSVIQSTVEGTGKSATTAASGQVRCSSLGALEKRIAELAKAGLTP